MNHPVTGLIVIAIFTAAGAGALETDQYYSWGRPLADSTDAINAKFNLELQRALAEFPTGPPPQECVDISIRYRKRLRFILFHSIQIWAMNSSLVDRIPADTTEHQIYRKTNLYSNHPVIDVGTWMPFTPTILIGGVRIGTDKLSHLISSGWTYYSVYRKSVADGMDPAAAEDNAVRRGLLEESLILGGKTSGVNSIADVEASFAGLSFYRDLCDSDEPILQRLPHGWAATRAIDLRDYVSPRWDESYLPPVYSERRWQKVQPVLGGYCERLQDPQVLEMRARYRARDRGSVVAKVVSELVAEAKLDDPSRFSIEAACGASFDPGGADVSDLGHLPDQLTDDGGDEAMIGRVLEEERDIRRRAVGLLGFQLNYPQVAAVSLGVMATGQPRTFDCRTVCDFWGPFAQIEPGLGGGKLSLGWGRAMGSTGTSDSFLSRAYLALAGKFTVYRTWSDLGSLSAGRTFAGAELEFSIAQVNFGLGALYQVDRTNDGRWLVTGGIGWGF